MLLPMPWDNVNVHNGEHLLTDKLPQITKTVPTTTANNKLIKALSLNRNKLIILR